MKLSLEQSRNHRALLAVFAGLSLGVACSDSEPDKFVSGGGSSGTGGMASGAGGGTGAGTGANSGGGTTGNGGGDSGGTSGASGNGGTVGLDAGVPVYEQDDPDLHPPESAYQRVKIPVAVSNVMSIDIDEEENVYVLERAGKLRIWKPDGTVIEAGGIDVFSGNEDGALNIALDPNFMTNRYAYIYYSSASGSPQNRLSRFEIHHDSLDLDSEKVLLTVPDERVVQWHVAGGLDFDSKGNLYLSTGDNTNPFESAGYAPIDERNNRAVYDAQRTSANSRDLRGKILRIKPRDDGGYDIPEGNLFDEDDGRPEIYIMGERNPFRIAVDRGKDWLYWGNVGPDAGSNGARGPMGYDEINQAKAAGNFGWPYCIANNIPYANHDFGSNQSGPLFDCNNLVNESPNNSGITKLPPAQPAWIAYTYGSSPYPALGSNGARTALAGAVYRWKPGGSINKLPRYYDGSVFIMEYSRGWLAEVRTDDDGKIQSVEKFFPSLDWKEPIQMRISPNGVLYVAQFGAGSTVYRINYIGDNNQPPLAVASSDVDSGALPLTVKFSSEGTSDAENDPLTYAWDLNGDNIVDSTEPNPSFTYTTAGAYEVTLVVSDGMNSGVAKLKIVAGNRRPVITITSPPNGAFVGEGETVSYSVTVTDAEDGTTPSGISCNDVIVTTALGHDLHEHAGTPTKGCNGTFTTVTGVIPTENAWQVLNVSYTDKAPNGLALTGEAKIRLHFKRKQAEHYPIIGEAHDVMLENVNDPQGGDQAVSYINDGSYICWNEMNFQGINSISYRVASAGTGGRIEVRQGSPTGTLIGTATNIAPTGGWQNWTTVTSGPIMSTGTNKVCFVFKNNPGDKLLFNLNFLNFNGNGVSQ
jgi:cytochrome c